MSLCVGAQLVFLIEMQSHHPAVDDVFRSAVTAVPSVSAIEACRHYCTTLFCVT